MTAGRPIASLSLDLDNQWSYMKTHGDAGWESWPSYLDIVVPLVLEELRRLDLTITFFVVGQDAALEPNRAALRSIADAGHEIANHSFQHEPWLHRYSEEDIAQELQRAEAAIENATGVHPRGFRGPGYSLSPAVIRELIARGYAYDASTLPTWIGPLARLYYFRTARLDATAREERQVLFGTWRDALRPLRPYRWLEGEADLVEIPVTTMPLLRSPIHLSYALFASGYSWRIARAYFAGSLALCRLTGVEPSILLHPLDFLGPEDLADRGDLAFFPAMGMTGHVKRERTAWCLDRLRRGFEVVTMERHAEQAAARRLRERTP